ncbi:hypothetical protein [uncultured Fretibacterium sp.]|uniref:hypothetical protein n=1 Tax=uncultured Fretibacterium sp. TaxID=1678694 RepID=UPI00325FAAFA
MEQTGIQERKKDLHPLPVRAANGSSSSIGAGGNTVAAVSSYVPAPVTRIGFLKGMIQVPDDFDTMGRAETRGLFEGGE